MTNIYGFLLTDLNPLYTSDSSMCSLSNSEDQCVTFNQCLHCLVRKKRSNRKQDTAKASDRRHENCCTFHLFSSTESIKQILLFSYSVSSLVFPASSEK